ncbi:MAG: type II toxin-antitoxin system prevent-host-death family antitoxin [Gammaproteobacteria bacterium]|nr:type II toxin-antitoxin system prevent-host-death family antitoxin [Gammaproteobacteria bacterium]
MMQYASLREVNQKLSHYVRIVEKGEEVIITRRGQPVARLAAIEAIKQLSEEQRIARERTRHRIQQGYSLGGGRFDRDASHEH